MKHLKLPVLSFNDLGKGGGLTHDEDDMIQDLGTVIHAKLDARELIEKMT